MRKLWCLVFLTVFVMPGLSSASSNSNILGISCSDDVSSFDIPAIDYVMENFFEEDHFIHVNNTSIILSSDQFLGIIALLSRYNATKNVDYLSYAESVWNYSEQFYDSGYNHSADDSEKYTLDNSYALLANLELYAVTDNPKYLHRAEDISKKIVSMCNNNFFKTSSNNDNVDIKTQAIASFALLETGNESYRQIALSALNATINVYLDDGYNQSGKYYAIDNAMMIVATAEAYKITGIESFKETSEETAMFLYNMSITFFDTFIGVAPFVEKNETGFFTQNYNTTVLDQVWSYMALMKTADITGNSSYKENALRISDTLLLFWDFNNGGFIDGLNNVNKTFEPNALAVIVFETPVTISLEDFYSEVSVVLPKSLYASSANPSVSSECYAVSNFTINASRDLTSKTVFALLSKISSCNVSYGEGFCFKGNKTLNFYFDSVLGKYFFLFANLTKGVNSFQSWITLPVRFWNMSITPDSIVVNFRSCEPAFVNHTEFFLESNVTVSNVSVNGKLIDNYFIETYDGYIKISINETIEYNKTHFVINYTDDEKPRIDDVRFMSEGKEINEITPYEDVWVECDVEDNNIIENVVLSYNNGSGWESKNMTLTEGKYQSYLDTLDKDVKIYIKVTDLSGNTYESQTYILTMKKSQAADYLILYVVLAILMIAVGLAMIYRKMLKERHPD